MEIYATRTALVSERPPARARGAEVLQSVGIRPGLGNDLYGEVVGS